MSAEQTERKVESEAEPTSTDASPPETSPNQPAGATPAIQVLKNNSEKIATYIKVKTALAAETVSQTTAKLGQRTWSQDGTALRSLKTTAADTLAKAAEGGAWFYQTSVKTAQKTAEQIRTMAWFSETLASLCKTEARTYPCPRIVMACCYTLAASGLEAEGIFKVEAEADAVELAAAQLGQGAVLFPPGTSPHSVAGLLKKFLISLQEPLLTFRLLSNWLTAMDDVDLIRSLLQQLPPANRNSLALLMTTCHRIAGQAAINEMDSQALAEVLAPLLLWRPPVKPEQGSSPKASPTSVDGAPPPSIPVSFPEDDIVVAEKPEAPPASVKPVPEIPPPHVPLDLHQLQAAERLVETMITNSLSLF